MAYGSGLGYSDILVLDFSLCWTCNISAWTIFSILVIPMYWSKDPLFPTLILSRLIRRDRYEQIRKMIHLSDPMQEDPDQSLRKVSSFLNLLAESYKRVYVQKQNDSADEYRSVSKGRLKFRVCVYIYIYIYIYPVNEKDMVSKYIWYLKVIQVTLFSSLTIAVVTQNTHRLRKNYQKNLMTFPIHQKLFYHIII